MTMTQTISCQNSDLKADNEFRIEKKAIFYNGEKILLGMPVETFNKVAGGDFRIARYVIPGKKTTLYYWISKKLHVTESENYFDVKELEIDETTGSFSPNWRDNAPEFPQFKSLAEVISRYGNYDSLKIEEAPRQEFVFYVWDEKGFNVAIDESANTVSQINIYPLHLTKTTLEPRLRADGVRIDTSDKAYFETDEADKVENYKIILERHPKNEFKGKFTYNGNTADFSGLNYTDWDKAVAALKIEGSEYDPPGDSKRWSREIREDYDSCMVDIIRFNNEIKGANAPSLQKTGKIDFIESIQIWYRQEEAKK